MWYLFFGIAYLSCAIFALYSVSVYIKHVKENDPNTFKDWMFQSAHMDMSTFHGMSLLYSIATMLFIAIASPYFVAKMLVHYVSLKLDERSYRKAIKKRIESGNYQTMILEKDTAFESYVIFYFGDFILDMEKQELEDKFFFVSGSDFPDYAYFESRESLEKIMGHFGYEVPDFLRKGAENGPCVHIPDDLNRTKSILYHCKTVVFIEELDDEEKDFVCECRDSVWLPPVSMYRFNFLVERGYSGSMNEISLTGKIDKESKKPSFATIKRNTPKGKKDDSQG